MKKVKQPNKTGGDPKMFSSSGEKWRTMTATQKEPWIKIAKENGFRSSWHAFNSSFFRSVAIHGLEYTINHELNYIESKSRHEKAESLNNSVKRLNKYKVKEEFYTQTEEILTTYPVAFSSEHVYLRLRNLSDVNNALSMKWLYRTDEFYDYQFTTTETDGNTEKGSYTLTKKPRQGQELFQLIS